MVVFLAVDRDFGCLILKVAPSAESLLACVWLFVLGQNGFSCIRVDLYLPAWSNHASLGCFEEPTHLAKAFDSRFCWCPAFNMEHSWSQVSPFDSSRPHLLPGGDRRKLQADVVVQWRLNPNANNTLKSGTCFTGSSVFLSTWNAGNWCMRGVHNPRPSALRMEEESEQKGAEYYVVYVIDELFISYI